MNLSDDHMAQMQQMVKDTQLDELLNTVKTYMNEKEMIYVVVGDAKTQLQRMAKLGYGQAIVLDAHGNQIN